MDFISVLVFVFGLFLVVSNSFNVYERVVLISERKRHNYPSNYLSAQYAADSLLILKYIMLLIYGFGFIIMLGCPLLANTTVFVISSLLLCYVLIYNFCNKRYKLEETYSELKEKWEEFGVNHDGYIDEVNVYRAIRDSKKDWDVFIVGILQIVTLFFM